MLSCTQLSDPKIRYYHIIIISSILVYVPSCRKDFFDVRYATVRTCVQPKSKLAEDHLFPYTKIAGLGTFKQVNSAPHLGSNTLDPHLGSNSARSIFTTAPVHYICL